MNLDSADNNVTMERSPFAKWQIGHGNKPAKPGLPLPMTRQEMTGRGWDACDIIIITGDAYIDHPAFGTALIGRFLESLGYRVGIISQPDIQNVETFRTLGMPRLFWGITAGNVDSQLARLTVMRKLRHNDAYSPDGKSGLRPPNASMVYSSMARQAFKGVPVILGGIEASLRRFAYYDYWTDKIRRSLIFDAKADLIAFGMAEQAIAEIALRLHKGQDLLNIPGTAEIRKNLSNLENVIEAPSYEDVSMPNANGKSAFLEMTKLIYKHNRSDKPVILTQKHGDRWLAVNPPVPPLTTAQLDFLYSLPFTRRPHPIYGSSKIPAYEMIRDSVTTHRGCYADCSFCAITSHQGTSVTSRSRQNILDEIRRISTTPDFHGTISDIGGPTANMYSTGCRISHEPCGRRNCLFPDQCNNLNSDHAPLMDILRSARLIPGVKHVFVTSGIRFDLALAGGGKQYIEELVRNHVCGLLKIAPEHVSDKVLHLMHKPGPKFYREFVRNFVEQSAKLKRRYAIVEYFMSGHPGCTIHDMIELAQYLRQSGIEPEQIQDYYPSPLTLSACMFYTGMDPSSGNRIYVARTDREKAQQRAILLCHIPEFQRKAREALEEAGRTDLIGYGKNCLVPPLHSGMQSHRTAGQRAPHHHIISKSHTRGR